MPDLLTIGDLAAMPAIGQRLVAGRSGLDRVVLWAHSCEMPDPWKWLGPDELLMTIGLCIPRGEKDQVELIRHISAARLAGVTIGQDEMAPPLHQAMLDEADRLGFPVLTTAHKVPFVNVARTVAMSSTAKQHQQLLLLSRLYRSLSTVARAPDEAVAQIERIFGITMAVVDVVTGSILIRGGFEPTKEALVELCVRARSQAPQTGASVSAAAGGQRAWHLSAERKALLMLADDSPIPDSFTMGHLLQAVTAIANHVLEGTLMRATRGEHVVTSVLAGTLPREALLAETELVRLDGPEYVVLATKTDHPEDHLVALHSTGVPALSWRRPGRQLCCIKADDLDPVLETLTSDGVRIGVSAGIGSLDDLDEASRQAAWAVGASTDRHPVTQYEDIRDSILPRDSESALEISSSVLGELLRPNRSRLLETLRVYLAHDRKWDPTAADLQIHRQTLAYRLRQIEAITDRSLQSSRDLAALWVAVAAIDYLQA